MTIRALAVDADGTLWDTPRAMQAGGLAAARALWPEISRDAARAFGVRFRSDPQGAFRAFVRGELTFDEMRRRRLDDAAACVGRLAPVGALADFELAYQPAFDAAMVAYADAPGLLRRAAEQGLPVRILTNSAHAYTLGKLATTGLGVAEDAVCSRDCLGMGKPEAAVFRHVCERLGVDPSEVLFVGDEWVSDAQGAADAGLEACWLVRDDGDPADEVAATAERRALAQARGIPVISSLAELLP